jgi:1-deoxy-D-xylulose-5-phosphate synthase
MKDLLETINSPSDLRKLSEDQLKPLCSEIREYMVDCCSTNPGHLGSSLGAVELIVGLHYIFNTPKDKLVFDVGHQAYAHKILTGRREAFRLNRTRDGISGFPQRAESTFDAFGTGHSSTSISAALGLAEAARMTGSGEKVVAMIGDGAMTGGLAWEGLNNAGASGADLLIILNDNNISIDRNIGGVHNYLLKITTSPGYNRFKRRVWERLGNRGIRSYVQKMVRDAKSHLVSGSGGAVFEALGFRYFGPIDGNDIAQVTDALRRLRDLPGPRILHCITTKGKGYAPAETDPTVWHAPGKFDPATGERVRVHYKADRYQDVFGEVLIQLAQMDGKVVGITPAMASGCGMTGFAEKMPGRFFDVGIEEEHAVTFAAGLAAGGIKPYCNIYSSFSQRAYDCIIHDVALQNLPVVLCFDRAGVVGEDGATHHGVFDMAAYRSIPNAVIAAPRDEIELKNLMYSGLSVTGGPYIIRYPRGCGEGLDWREASWKDMETGKGQRLTDGEDVAVLALGPSANRAVEAAEAYEARTGKSVRVYDMRFLKPVDTSILEEVARDFDRIITVEDGALKGGLFSEVSEYMCRHGLCKHVSGLGIPDKFVPQDTQAQQRAECRIDREGILAEIDKILKK